MSRLPAIVAGMAPWLRSTLAVLAGLVVFYALEGLGYWICFHTLHVRYDTPTREYEIASLVYTFAAAIGGGYAAAVLGGRNPVSHGVGLAMLLFGLDTINLAKSAGSMHIQYVLMMNIGVPLLAIFGAFLRRSHTE